MAHGGKRSGSGLKKGQKIGPHKATVLETIDKALKREELRRLVAASLEPMVRAQVANAVGLKYLVTRDKKSGKFIRVTEAMAKAKLGDDSEIIEVWEKDPSVQAFSYLLDQTIDAPPKSVAVTGPDGTPLVVKWQE